MKSKLLFIILFFSLGLSVFSQEEEAVPGQLEIILNGQVVTPEVLSAQMFCMNANDTITLTYLPETVEEEIDFVLFSIELWAQVNLGQPTLMGQLEKSEPGKVPSVTFRLAELQSKALFPPKTTAVRGNIRLRQVLKVNGRRVLEVIPLKEMGTLPINVVPLCPKG